MAITFELWQLITLAGTLLSAFLALAWALLSRMEAGVNRSLRDLKESGETRFTEMMAANAESSASLRRDWENRVGEIRKDSEKWSQIERDFLKHLAELPVHYVRREDYVRGQTVIEAKLDAIASELKTVQIQGSKS